MLLKLKLSNRLNLKFFQQKRYAHINTQILSNLNDLFGLENVAVSEAIRAHHSKDESFYRFSLKNRIIELFMNE